MIKENLRGEITLTEIDEKYSMPELDFIDVISDSFMMKRDQTDNVKLLQSLILPNICFYLA